MRETLRRNRRNHHSENGHKSHDLTAIENREWGESLEWILQEHGPERAVELLQLLRDQAVRRGAPPPDRFRTPYLNTIPPETQAAFEGDLDLHLELEGLTRWNAMAMVVKANRKPGSLGGHIATYASAATLYEIGFNHFIKAPSDDHPGDVMYVQGHSAPGLYARSFLEGRFTEQHLENFRRELAPEGGLASYPHTWLMPDYWQVATVSMGLGPIESIYHARFNKYVHARGIKDTSDVNLWVFLGDGEMDEPESTGAITLAGREKLDNLTWLINCNLQRLDGPVRGNGKVILELEGLFRAADWNVIKVLWSSEWDDLFARDTDGLLVKHLESMVDGTFQRLATAGPDLWRELVFEATPDLKDRFGDLSDETIASLKMGGHDPVKVFAAYKAAAEHKGQPTVILSQSVKGYGLGDAGEGKNTTHQQKKLKSDQLQYVRERFNIAASDEDIEALNFLKPADDAPVMEYLRKNRDRLNGFMPQRRDVSEPLKVPGDDLYAEFLEGSGDKEVATTMALVRLIGKLLRDKEIGHRLVPIIPDEARTFGMEGLFRQVGIYAHEGQKYEPVDKGSLMYYRESEDGQILEEGITEAGATCSWIAAATGYAQLGEPMIPFYIFYSMFGLQRVGDLVWGAGDMRARGFLIGATSGRTTLNGEGLQHQDGHSHLLAMSLPTCRCYHPAYGYEIATIIQDGIQRMYVDGEDIFYYLTVENEPYHMPGMPKDEGVREGILRGMYRVAAPSDGRKKPMAHLFGSGPMLKEALKAQEILAGFDVPAAVYSVTSYKQLRTESLAVERWNLLNPTEKPRTSYLMDFTRDLDGVFVASSDWVKDLPDSIAKWLPGPLVALGTDGFGRSETREALRDFFEVDARYIALGALTALYRQGKVKKKTVEDALKKLDIVADKPNPMTD